MRNSQKRLYRRQICVCRANKVKCDCKWTYFLTSVMSRGNFKKDDKIRHLWFLYGGDLSNMTRSKLYPPYAISVDHYRSFSLWHTSFIKKVINIYRPAFFYIHHDTLNALRCRSSNEGFDSYVHFLSRVF